MLLVDSELKPKDLKQKTELIRSLSTTVEVPQFVPKKVNIITDESVTKKEEEYTDEDEILCNQILQELPPPKVCNQA
jgi:hypothetical protein